jgi:hypothetical protein
MIGHPACPRFVEGRLIVVVGDDDLRFHDARAVEAVGLQVAVDHAEAAQRLGLDVLGAIGRGRHGPQEAAAARQAVQRNGRFARQRPVRDARDIVSAHASVMQWR